MDYRFNPCIAELKPSASVELMEKAKKMKAQGIDVISLAGGEPNFDTPASVTNAGIRGMVNSNTHYVTSAGLYPLRKKIADRLKEKNDIPCKPEQILVTPGGKFAIYAAVRTLLCPGDEVLIPTPSWVSYNAIVQASGGIPVPVPLSYEDNYTITREKLEKAYTPHARLLIINTPNNPTGRMITKEEAETLLLFAKKHKLLIISDEIYSQLVYDGNQHISLASYPGAFQQVITVNGFSKFAAMTGWRIGFLCGCEEIVHQIQKLFQHTVTCVPGFIQDAALVACDLNEEVDKMRNEYSNRRREFIRVLNAIEGVDVRQPEGAFYAWMHCAHFENNSIKLAELLLEKAKVAGIPASAFSSEDPCIRFSFAASMEDLLEAGERIRKTMQSIL